VKKYGRFRGKRSYQMRAMNLETSAHPSNPYEKQNCLLFFLLRITELFGRGGFALPQGLRLLYPGPVSGGFADAKQRLRLRIPHESQTIGFLSSVKMKFFRKRRDSNPRSLAGLLFSRQTRSATLPLFQMGNITGKGVYSSRVPCRISGFF
jgi:hypothetical protein